MEPQNIINEVMNAQADLQTALGILRLEMGQPQGWGNLPKDDIQQHNLIFSEERMAKSLARLHKLLDALGNPMFDPATHPEVWDGPPRCSYCGHFEHMHRVVYNESIKSEHTRCVGSDKARNRNWCDCGEFRIDESSV